MGVSIRAVKCSCHIFIAIHCFLAPFQQFFVCFITKEQDVCYCSHLYVFEIVTFSLKRMSVKNALGVKKFSSSCVINSFYRKTGCLLITLLIKMALLSKYRKFLKFRKTLQPQCLERATMFFQVPVALGMRDTSFHLTVEFSPQLIFFHSQTLNLNGCSITLSG